MTYPSKVEVDGKEYSINTGYENALRCFDVCNDESISDSERALAIVFLIFGFIPEDDLIERFLRMAILFLQCGKTKEEQERSVHDMDFSSDMSYITASFMSDYKIDLSVTDMHWWQFVDLITGLTEHSVLSRVRELRNFDVSDIKDKKIARKIQEAQDRVALPIHRTKEEQAAIDKFESLFDV